ncbi:MAG: hypothetical protein ABW022_07305 [Actinoplanes sp.]
MTNDPFSTAYRLAPVPAVDGTTEDWVRHHAAQSFAAWAQFRLDARRPAGDRNVDLGLLASLGVASLHAAIALSSIHRGPIPQELYDLTPEAGALNGEWEEWLTDTLDRLGVNPADINNEYVAAAFRSPSRKSEVAR